jgi:hypothetical protein
MPGDGGFSNRDAYIELFDKNGKEIGNTSIVRLFFR